jgi:ParB family chromosome partitioning protein
MTQISDIVKDRKSKFEKKHFRPWDLSGQNQENISEENENNPDTSALKDSNLISPHAIGGVLEIDVKKIIRWEYKDRPENELGDIEELANTFKTIGQQQPCILRVAKNFPGQYELIVGERRWRAAQLAKVKLKAIVHQELDDKTAVLIQAVENEKRSDLSEFAKGMSYAEKIEKGLISQKDLIEILGIRKQQVSRLLSYKRIPEALFDAIEDFRNVSARTAEEIARLASKGEHYIDALISLAAKIRTGKCGHNSIANEINNLLEKDKTALDTNQKVFNTDGRHLFTWRLDNNAIPSIHFPKDIIKLLKGNVITQEELSNDVKACIAKRLAEIKD